MTQESPPAFPLRAVAALFITRQHLARPRSRRLTDRHLVQFASDTGGIQIDSINVLDRAHYLTVWSRFGPYDRRALDRAVYERRLLFEYWAHAACLVPTTQLASWRRAMLDYSRRDRAWGMWLQENEPLVAEVEAALTARGPLGAAAFAHSGERRRNGWWDWKPAAHALDYLWMSGRALVHSRVHFQKRFDLASRVMGETVACDVPSAEEFFRWHLRRSLHALGAATWADLRMYLTFPRAATADRRAALAASLASGEVVEVTVEDARGKRRKQTPWFALAEDLPALHAAARQRAPARGTTMLTPFDSFLWYRERAARLFGFDYRIEVYTPGHKRAHGYYVVPLFHDGQLIGRVDPKLHRSERLLEIKRVHFEPWFARRARPPAADWGALDVERALAGVAETIRSLATFVGASRITLGRVLPLGLGAPLRRALRVRR